MHFSILIFDEPNSAALRDKHRKAHLDFLKEFDDQTLFAGPFTTDDEAEDLGSFRLINFADRAAAEEHVASEPYVVAGVQKRWQIERWQASLPYTWRDCPRRAGNVQALFHGVDHPGSMSKRSEYREAQDDYLDEHAGEIMMRGPLIDDAGTGATGSVWLLDVVDLDAGRALIAGAPYSQARVHEDVMFHRWRFGRVFDRLKV